MLNDNFRFDIIGGQVVMTRGVAELPLDQRLASFLRCRASRTSMPRTMTHTASMTSAASTRRGDLLLQGRLLRPRHARRFGRSRRSGEDDARAHHHARRRILIHTNRKETPMADSNPPIVPTPSSNVAKARTTFGSRSARPLRTNPATDSTWSCKPCRSPTGTASARSFCVRRRAMTTTSNRRSAPFKTTNPALDAGSRPPQRRADSRAAGNPDGSFSYIAAA